METHEKIGLKKILFENIIKTITGYKDIRKIVVFGSRARSDYKFNSDIDLALFSDELNSTDINIIKNNLEELHTALKFDVVAYRLILKETLRNNIVNKGITVYEQR